MQHDQSLIDRAHDQFVCKMDYTQRLATLKSLVSGNDQWRSACINLVASETRMSPNAQAVLASGLSMRTAGGYIGKNNRFFIASHNIDTLESCLFATLTRLFSCDQAEWRLSGGTQASQVVYASLCRPRDTIVAVTEEMGGDSSNSLLSMPGYLDLSVIPVPFEEDGLTIDLTTLSKLISLHRPVLVSLGFSVSLFYPPLKEIKKCCRESNALLYYDAAHELGLIAGKQLPNPFEQGVDVVSGSTGKSFSGPHGGLILWNDSERVQALKQRVFPGFVGTYQLNRMVALCFAACELDAFGRPFMSSVAANARELARLLTDHGLSVHGRSKGYTETNQLLLYPPADISSLKMARKLEAINIICNPVVVPGKNAKALRLSTTEITRQGMGTKEMQLIAQLIAAVYFNRKPAQLLARQASQLVAGFQDIKYC